MKFKTEIISDSLQFVIHFTVSVESQISQFVFLGVSNAGEDVFKLTQLSVSDDALL